MLLIIETITFITSNFLRNSLAFFTNTLVLKAARLLRFIVITASKAGRLFRFIFITVTINFVAWNFPLSIFFCCRTGQETTRDYLVWWLLRVSMALNRTCDHIVRINLACCLSFVSFATVCLIFTGPAPLLFLWDISSFDLILDRVGRNLLVSIITNFICYVTVQKLLCSRGVLISVEHLIMTSWILYVTVHKLGSCGVLLSREHLLMLIIMTNRIYYVAVHKLVFCGVLLCVEHLLMSFIANLIFYVAVHKSSWGAMRHYLGRCQARIIDRRTIFLRHAHVKLIHFCLRWLRLIICMLHGRPSVVKESSIWLAVFYAVARV